MFGFDYTKNIATALEDLMKAVAHRHVLLSALRFFLQYKALASGKRKTKSIPGKIRVSPCLTVMIARV